MRRKITKTTEYVVVGGPAPVNEMIEFLQSLPEDATVKVSIHDPEMPGHEIVTTYTAQTETEFDR